MYTEFFGLREAPFNGTLDPKFFFASPQHEEALASLIYAAKEKKGLVVVTGEVGMGKTMLSRLMLTHLGSQVSTAVINNSQLPGTDILPAICREFQIPFEPTGTTMELLATLEDYLLTQQSKDRNSLIVIDDAHTLQEVHFEQLRLVSNLEVAGGKLVQIVLLGQFHLQNLLKRSSMKQLSQRIFRSFHLTRFKQEQTESYIQHRLRVAGFSRTEALFTPEALDIIHQYADGTPRLINNLCDNLLISAFSSGQSIIDAPQVQLVIDEIVTGSEENAAAFNQQPDEVDQAISQMTEQYVQSLENQINELETAAVDTDRRIQELHRLSAKLRSQELKFNEHQGLIDSKLRDLHRLTVVLQEQEHTLSNREKSLTTRLEELRILSDKLDTQEKALAEREARMGQQVQEMNRATQLLVDQDQKLTERATFIDKKLANRQVAFDQELNECKRLINRKWTEIKDLVTIAQDQEQDRQKRIELLDQRLGRYDNLLQQLNSQEQQLHASKMQIQGVISESQSIRQEFEASFSARQTDAQQLVTQLDHLLNVATTLLNQPQEILVKTARQVEQVERMSTIVQQASEALQKSVERSVETSKKATVQGETTCQRLTELDENAQESIVDLNQQVSRTQKLREVLGQIYKHSEEQVHRLSEQVRDADQVVGRMTKKIAELRDTVEKPTQLMRELRTMGSATERNLHDGQLRLNELQNMIEKADRARKSIEALIHATRLVAEKRRPVAPAEAEMISSSRVNQELAEAALTERQSSLTQKIESLAETMRKSRITPTVKPVIPITENS
ncbi:MAG: hypothetical protein HJJLKODD_00347 [Phycisphaerae bacterium]|nr:hypothetical protein [Phycisphaerae bacterium]